MFTVDEALREVQSKTEEQIERETAYKWASRSIACYKLFLSTQDLRWLLQAEDYRHEALEHASLTGDMGATLRIIEGTVDQFRPRE